MWDINGLFSNGGTGWWILLGSVWFIISLPVIISLSIWMVKKLTYLCSLFSEVSKATPYTEKDRYTRVRLYQKRKGNYILS